MRVRRAPPLRRFSAATQAPCAELSLSMVPLGRPGGRALPRGVGCPLNVRYSSPVRRGGVPRTKKIPPLWGGVPLRDGRLFGEGTDLVSGHLELAAQALTCRPDPPKRACRRTGESGIPLSFLELRAPVFFPLRCLVPTSGSYARDSRAELRGGCSRRLPFVLAAHTNNVPSL